MRLEQPILKVISSLQWPMVGWIGGAAHQKSVGVFIYLYGPANVNSVTLLILHVLKEKYTYGAER
jgi:hypothetical protein